MARRCPDRVAHGDHGSTARTPHAGPGCPFCPVTDLTATLTAEQQAGWRRACAPWKITRTANSPCWSWRRPGPPSKRYALRVAEQWKAGRKRIRHSAVLLVARNDRAVRIEVGYRLRGMLNDATSKRIISESIVPLASPRNFGGIEAGIDRMIKLVDGEALPATAANRGPNAGFPDARAAAAGLRSW